MLLQSSRVVCSGRWWRCCGGLLGTRFGTWRYVSDSVCIQQASRLPGMLALKFERRSTKGVGAPILAKPSGWKECFKSVTFTALLSHVQYHYCFLCQDKVVCVIVCSVSVCQCVCLSLCHSISPPSLSFCLTRCCSCVLFCMLSVVVQAVCGCTGCVWLCRLYVVVQAVCSYAGHVWLCRLLEETS